MKLLDALVEQRIAAAAARGEFDDLPGAGAPQELNDDLLVPEEVRVANRILKNAGFVPPAVEQLRSLRHLQDELAAAGDRTTRCRLQAKLLALDMALESLSGRRRSFLVSTAAASRSGCSSAWKASQASRTQRRRCAARGFRERTARATGCTAAVERPR